jgi:hypothetical protein
MRFTAARRGITILFSGQERPERQFPLSLRLVVRERVPVERDAQYAAHVCRDIAIPRVARDDNRLGRIAW